MLTERHRFELALLCGEYADRYEAAGAFDAITALLIGYTLAEGLKAESFTDRDRAEFPPAFMAATVAWAGVDGGKYQIPPAGTTGSDVVARAETLFQQFCRSEGQ